MKTSRMFTNNETILLYFLYPAKYQAHVYAYVRKHMPCILRAETVSRKTFSIGFYTASVDFHLFIIKVDWESLQRYFHKTVSDLAYASISEIIENVRDDVRDTVLESYLFEKTGKPTWLSTSEDMVNESDLRRNIKMMSSIRHDMHIHYYLFPVLQVRKGTNMSRMKKREFFEKSSKGVC